MEESKLEKEEKGKFKGWENWQRRKEIN